MTSGSRDPEAALIAKSAIWQALDVLPPRRGPSSSCMNLRGWPFPRLQLCSGSAQSRFGGTCRWAGAIWPVHSRLIWEARNEKY